LLMLKEELEDTNRVTRSQARTNFFYSHHEIKSKTKYAIVSCKSVSSSFVSTCSGWVTLVTYLLHPQMCICIIILSVTRVTLYKS
jgi:hypothetical protein